LFCFSLKTLTLFSQVDFAMLEVLVGLGLMLFVIFQFKTLTLFSQVDFAMLAILVGLGLMLFVICQFKNINPVLSGRLCHAGNPSGSWADVCCTLRGSADVFQVSSPE
jgi:hypothetical protein